MFIDMLFPFKDAKSHIPAWIGSPKMQPLTLTPSLYSLVRTRFYFFKVWYIDIPYLDQQSFDPYNGDAGNGLLPNGSYVIPPDQNKVYTPWNTTLAKNWLSGLLHKPSIVAIDNEIEIASSTHQDMHPKWV